MRRHLSQTLQLQRHPESHGLLGCTQCMACAYEIDAIASQLSAKAGMLFIIAIVALHLQISMNYFGLPELA